MIEPKDAEIARLTQQLASLKEEHDEAVRKMEAGYIQVAQSGIIYYQQENERLTQQLAAANGRVEKLENALSLAIGMIGHPDNIALLQAALSDLPQSEDVRDSENLLSLIGDIAKVAGRDVPDCVDNDGQPYQSAALDAAIKAAISAQEEKA